MNEEVTDAIAKLREIEEQSHAAVLELPPGSIAFSRLRHIGILARFARMKLQGVRVDAMEPMSEPSGQPTGLSKN